MQIDTAIIRVGSACISSLAGAIHARKYVLDPQLIEQRHYNAIRQNKNIYMQLIYIYTRVYIYTCICIYIYTVIISNYYIISTSCDA